MLYSFFNVAVFFMINFVCVTGGLGGIGMGLGPGGQPINTNRLSGGGMGSMGPGGQHVRTHAHTLF